MQTDVPVSHLSALRHLEQWLVYIKGSLNISCYQHRLLTAHAHRGELRYRTSLGHLYWALQESSCLGELSRLLWGSIPQRTLFLALPQSISSGRLSRERKRREAEKIVTVPMTFEALSASWSHRSKCLQYNTNRHVLHNLQSLQSDKERARLWMWEYLWHSALRVRNNIP